MHRSVSWPEISRHPVDFTAATGEAHMRRTNWNVNWKDWSFSIHPIIASWRKPLYAHGKHINAAPPLGTEGSFRTGINLASLSVLRVG